MHPADWILLKEFVMPNWGETRFLTSARLVRHVMTYRRFKNLFSIIKHNPKVYWPAIFRFLSQNKKFVSLISFRRKYPERFLVKLLKVGCRDLNLVRRILKLYELHLSRNQAHPYFVFYNQKIDEVCEQVCSPLDSHEIEDVNHFSYVEMIKFAFNVRDVKFMTALLKYGLWPEEVSESEYPDTVRALKLFKEIGIHFPELVLRKDGQLRITRRTLTILRIIDILGIKRSKTNVYENNFCRHIKLINSVKCLKLYLRATVEPLISKDEVVDYLCSLFHHIPEDFLQGMAVDYEILFCEEFASTYTPRSLKHLCRHKVRRYAVEKKLGVLPELIKTLQLPKSIARYLLCEC